MLRQVRDWWPFLRVPVLMAGTLALAAVCSWWIDAGGFVALSAGLCVAWTALVVALLTRRRSVFGRLVRRAWRFQTFRTRRVVLRFDPAWHSEVRVVNVLRVCEDQLDELAERFGHWLRRPVTVFLLRDTQEVTSVYGRDYAGFALVEPNAIIISPTSRLTPAELIRHELAHLFAGRWGPSRPSLNSEGIAVWLQGTEKGLPIDQAALPYFRNRSLRLPAMLTESFFHDPDHQHACYLLAGSFTGFLIRRFGWRAYRRFYRTVANWGCYRRVFRWHFGTTLERAEWHWRNELLVPEALRRRMQNVV